jgi:hypothetical protein
MRFRELFTIELLHDYMADGKATGLLLMPTEDCLHALQKQGLIFKFHGNKGYIISRTPEGIKPAVELPDSIAFHFLLQITDTALGSYTNLPIGSKRYLLHNLVNGVANGVKYLYPPLPAYDAAASATLGMLTKQGADVIECLGNFAGGAHSIGNTAHWRNCGQVSYLHAPHQLLFTGLAATFPVAPDATNVQVQLFGYNLATNAYKIGTPVLDKTFENKKAVSQQSVDLKQLPEGRYLVRVNGIDTPIYHRPAADWTTSLGLVQILHHSGTPADYRLVNAGNLLSPVFTIRLAPALRLWRYKARTAFVKKVYDSTGAIEFDQAGDLFTSKLPQRVRQQAYDKICLEYNNTDPPDAAKKIVLDKIQAPDTLPVAKDPVTLFPVIQSFLNY